MFATHSVARYFLALALTHTAVSHTAIPGRNMTSTPAFIQCVCLLLCICCVQVASACVPPCEQAKLDAYTLQNGARIQLAQDVFRTLVLPDNTQLIVDKDPRRPEYPPKVVVNNSKVFVLQYTPRKLVAVELSAYTHTFYQSHADIVGTTVYGAGLQYQTLGLSLINQDQSVLSLPLLTEYGSRRLDHRTPEWTSRLDHSQTSSVHTWFTQAPLRAALIDADERYAVLVTSVLATYSQSDQHESNNRIELIDLASKQVIASRMYTDRHIEAISLSRRGLVFFSSGDAPNFDGLPKRVTTLALANLSLIAEQDSANEKPYSTLTDIYDLDRFGYLPNSKRFYLWNSSGLSIFEAD